MEFEFGKSIPRKVVKKFENTHAIRFPQEYIKIATSNDGGCPSLNACKVLDPMNLSSMTIGVDELIAFVQLEGRSGNTMDAANDGGIDGLPKELIAFGREAGGIIFAFDYRSNRLFQDPPVVCYFNEYPDDKAIFPVADNFTDFLNALLPYPDIDESELIAP